MLLTGIGEQNIVKKGKMYPLYWDVALKPKNSGISACIKYAFWPFLDYGFNAASKTGNLGLNAAFNIEILLRLLIILRLLLKY